LTWSLAGQPLQSVLVTRLRYLGDIVMSTVVPEVLKLGDANLDIGFLCEASYNDLLTAHPVLDRVHAVVAKRSGREAAVRRAQGRSSAGAGRSAWQVARQIRKHGYDLTVDLFFNPRSALLVRLGGSRWRIGGSRSLRRHLYTHSVQPPAPGTWSKFRRIAPGGLGDHLSRLAPLRHEETGREFLAWCSENLPDRPLRPRVAVPDLVGTAVAAQLADLGISAGQPYVLLAPGATWASKRWPTEHWIDLARRLGEQSALPLVVLAPPVGDGEHATIVADISPGRGGGLPCLDLADALRVVGGASVVICVDGGIMHAAVAMGRPTLALFGPTSPAIWFPYAGTGPFQVLATRPSCHPCDRLECDAFVCLPDLTPAAVATAAMDLLASDGAVS